MSKSPKLHKISASAWKIGKWILLTLLIGFIGYTINPVITDWFANPIENSPKYIEIKPFFAENITQGTVYPFNIVNKKDKAYFGVWIKIILPAGMEYLSPTITIEPKTIDPNKTVDWGDDELLCQNFVRFDGIDARDRKCIWILIYSVEPRQAMSFEIKFINPNLIRSIKKHISFSIEVLNKYLESPPPFSVTEILKGTGEVSTYFTPPENIKRWKTSLLIAKKTKGTKDRTLDPRPLITIGTDRIEYSNWTHQERLDDPEVTKNYDKIKLYFLIHNASDQPAANVDINATSEIIDDKNIGQFIPGDFKTSYTHNKHLIVKGNPARQPFILALDKRATKYFKDGTIKVKLIIKVNYTDLSRSQSYRFEGAYIYSPILKKNAEELYSKGI